MVGTKNVKFDETIEIKAAKKKLKLQTLDVSDQNVNNDVFPIS